MEKVKLKSEIDLYKDITVDLYGKIVFIGDYYNLEFVDELKEFKPVVKPLCIVAQSHNDESEYHLFYTSDKKVVAFKSVYEVDVDGKYIVEQ
jgi:hypothetical protein